MPAAPLPYSDAVETVPDDEESVISEVIETMAHTMQQGFEEHRHATSATHAKSHGIVVGSLEVHADLPPELAQGLFAEPATYEVVMRYASEPGQIDPDTAQRGRGAALKVLSVPGEKLREGWTSQDFLLNTMTIIPQGDAATFLNAVRARDQFTGHHLLANAKTLLGHPSPKESVYDQTPNITPVAHTYYSQGAFRYGAHVAKFALRPADEVTAASEREVEGSDPPGVLSTWVHDFYATHTGTYEFCVQLQTDAEAMPVEDGSVEWSEEESPYRPVATVTFAPQETFSPERRVFAEDQMSWRPWYGLAAFRPLGSINRLRQRAYAELGRIRHETNARAEVDPTSLADVPD